MKLIVTFAISCIAIVVMAAGINGLNSETVSAQNIETLSLKDMQVMYGGGDMEECSVTGSGSCFAKPGMTCNDTWVQRNCVFKRYSIILLRRV